MEIKFKVCSVILLVLVQETIQQHDDLPLPNYPCNVHESINIQNGQLLANGSMFHNGIVYPSHLFFTYNPDEENVDNRFNTFDFIGSHLRGCVCELKPCIRKCCPRNQLLIGKVCNHTTMEFRFNVTDEDNNYLGDEAFDEFAFVYGNPCFGGLRFQLDPFYSEDEYRLLENGSLYLPYSNKPIVPVMQYCMDYQLPQDFLNSNLTEEDIEEYPYIVLQCMDNEPMEEDLKFTLYPLGMIFSIPFLVATFIVHLILPELQTLHGKSLMCYVGGLSMGYIVLATVQLASSSINDTTCIVLGLLVYFSFMLSFFWLNVMSFDIWFTFSGIGGFRGGAKEAERKKFICYWLYAWGVSLIAFGITVTLHYSPGIPSEFQPGFGDERCWLKESALFPYFYLPAIILIAVNIGFFSATAWKIYGIDRDTAVLRRDGSTKHSKVDDDKQRFWLYIKLFLIMGVNWTMEIISWLVGGPTWLWITTDLVNTIQGILIFLFFVWKPKIKQLLIRRFNSWRGKTTASGTYRSGVSSGHSSGTTQTNMSSVGFNGNNTKNQIEKAEKALI